MSDPTADEVRETFEDGGFEVHNVERNRGQYRVFLHPEGVEADPVEALLEDAYGADSVFGVGLTDEMWGDDDVQVKVVSFRVR